jgi:hypothetical protein
VSEFRALRKGGVHAELPTYAAALVASLARQLVELLSDGEAQEPTDADPLEAMLDFDSPREAPDDPALLRLLPDAHRDDAEVAAEFRRFTERSIREGKVDDAIVVLRSLGADREDLSQADDGGTVEFELDKMAVRSWMRCLSDLRLTLASRLEVTAGDEELWASLPEDDERLPVYEIYGWLGYLLESLLDVAR